MSSMDGVTCKTASNSPIHLCGDKLSRRWNIIGPTDQCRLPTTDNTGTREQLHPYQAEKKCNIPLGLYHQMIRYQYDKPLGVAKSDCDIFLDMRLLCKQAMTWAE